MEFLENNDIKSVTLKPINISIKTIRTIKPINIRTIKYYAEIIIFCYSKWLIMMLPITYRPVFSKLCIFHTVSIFIFL